MHWHSPGFLVVGAAQFFRKSQKRPSLSTRLLLSSRCFPLPFCPCFLLATPHNPFSHLPGGLHAFLSLSNPVCRIFDQLRQQEEINAQAPFIIHIFGSSPAICPSATSDQANKPSRNSRSPSLPRLAKSIAPSFTFQLTLLETTMGQRRSKIASYCALGCLSAGWT